MEDKKELTNFKQEIRDGLLSQTQIVDKAGRLLQLEQSSVLRFNHE